MQLIYTPVYAALLGLFILILALKVVILRRKKRIGIESKGDLELAQKIRVHGNTVEYVPIALLLMAFVELAGAGLYWVNASGLCLILGRILHAYGLGRYVGISFGRFYGTFLTWIVIIINSGYILGQAVMRLLS